MAVGGLYIAIRVVKDETDMNMNGSNSDKDEDEVHVKNEVHVKEDKTT